MILINFVVLMEYCAFLCVESQVDHSHPQEGNKESVRENQYLQLSSYVSKRVS